MQRKAIKAGVIYANTSAYGPPSPVVFLEDGAVGLYTVDRYNSTRIRPVTESATTKARAGRGWNPAIGYAAVMANLSRRDPEWETVIEAMRAIDPVAELERFKASANPAAEVLRFEIVSSLNKITDWEQATAAYEAGREADRRRSAEAEARRDRTQAAADALKQYGITTAYRTVVPGAEGVTILIEDAERLLEMLAPISRETEAAEDEHPEGAIGRPRPIRSVHGEWTLTGYDEKGFACLDEECPSCSARALILNEADAAECLTCAWREGEPR